MLKKIVVFALLISAIACKNEPSSTGGEAQKEMIGKRFPTLPQDQYSKMFQFVTSMDLIAYQANLSMTFDDPNSVRTVLGYVSKDATSLPDNCKKTARVTLLSNGNIYKEADVYAYDGCNAFVFFENGTGTYANALDPLGVEFFQRYMPKEDVTPEQIQQQAEQQ